MTNVAKTKWTAWGAIALGIAAGIGAHPFDAYRRVSWYDEALHMYMSGAFAFMVSLYLAQGIFGALPGKHWRRMVLAICVTLTVAVIWEIAEWLYDMAVAPDTIKGKWDTMVDFCVDFAGASVGSLLGQRIAPTPARATGPVHLRKVG